LINKKLPMRRRDEERGGEREQEEREGERRRDQDYSVFNEG
jgi:hypothetical protein